MVPAIRHSLRQSAATDEREPDCSSDGEGDEDDDGNEAAAVAASFSCLLHDFETNSTAGRPPAAHTGIEPVHQP